VKTKARDHDTHVTGTKGKWFQHVLAIEQGCWDAFCGLRNCGRRLVYANYATTRMNENGRVNAATTA